MTCMGAWKPLRKNFEDFMSAFRKHHKNVKSQANLAHKIEAKKERELQQANRDLQQRNERIMRRHRMLSCLPTVDYYKKQTARALQRYPGTNAWLLHHPLFERWIATTRSDCFCCYGIPGSGKSILSSSIISDLQQYHTSEEFQLIYYYFDWSDGPSIEPERLLGSLVKQLILQMQLTSMDDLPPEFDPPYSVSRLQQCLQNLITHYEGIFLVLDGLDELSQEGQAFTLNLIRDVLRQPQPIVKVLITSRPEERLIREHLKGWKTLELSAGDIQEDIELFVTGEIDAIIAHGSAYFPMARMRQEIVRTLTEKAHGMYVLYLRIRGCADCHQVSLGQIPASRSERGL
jgi:hypothetical protein